MTHRLHRRLIAWYAANARDLPWRASDRTPWQVLVSEVMLQQTQVERVRPVYEQWVERWPTPTALAAASPADVIRAWGRLGYPRRALRLQAAAVMIVEHHHGVVPREIGALRALPGVGEYTAAAVSAFAYAGRQPVLDTNVRRVLARLISGVATPPPSVTNAERTWASDLLPATGPAAAQWSVAVMELGALVCTSGAPRCGRCPVRDDCAWLAAGQPPSAPRQRAAAPYAGSQREARGLVLARLRSTDERLSDDRASGDLEASRAAPAIASLVADGLVERDRDGRLGLPPERAPVRLAR